MSYSIPYLILLLFFAVCAFFYENSENDSRKRDCTVLSILVFFVFFAFRGYLYTDWSSYVKYFDAVEWEDVLNWNMTGTDIKEPGFVLLCMVCKTVLNNYFFLVFVCISIDTWLFLRFLKRRGIENVAFAFMLFITFEGLIIMFNLLRNAIAIFIFLNSLEFIEKRKPLPYFGLCLLALMFHTSSVIYFPLYFFLHRRMNRWVFLGVFVFCLLFYLSKVSIVLTAAKILGMEDMFGGKLEVYTEMYASARALSMTGTVEKFGLVALVFLYYDELTTRFKNRVVVINSLVLYLVMYYILAEFRTLSTRFATLFVFSYWVLWIDIFHVLYVKNNKRLLCGVLFIYCAYILAQNTNTPCQEYDNILFGAKSYQERLKILNRTYEEDD